MNFSAGIKISIGIRGCKDAAGVSDLFGLFVSRAAVMRRFSCPPGIGEHLPHNRKTSFAFDCITPLTQLHLQML